MCGIKHKICRPWYYPSSQEIRTNSEPWINPIHSNIFFFFIRNKEFKRSWPNKEFKRPWPLVGMKSGSIELRELPAMCVLETCLYSRLYNLYTRVWREDYRCSPCFLCAHSLVHTNSFTKIFTCPKIRCIYGYFTLSTK